LPPLAPPIPLLQLANVLAADLNLKLSSPVASIDYSGDSVVVTSGTVAYQVCLVAYQSGRRCCSWPLGPRARALLRCSARHGGAPCWSVGPVDMRSRAAAHVPTCVL
jgi:hypothetical protein